MGNKAGKIALGLGLLTGAVTGLLFAPEEGKKIRQKLGKGDTKGLLKDLESVGDEIKKMVMDLSKNPSMQEALDKAKDKAADVASMKREELDSLLKKASSKADQFKNKLSAYVKEQKLVLEEHLEGKGKAKTMKKKAAPKKAAKPAAKKASTKKRKK